MDQRVAAHRNPRRKKKGQRYEPAFFIFSLFVGNWCGQWQLAEGQTRTVGSGLFFFFLLAARGGQGPKRKERVCPIVLLPACPLFLLGTEFLFNGRGDKSLSLFPLHRVPFVKPCSDYTRVSGQKNERGRDFAKCVVNRGGGHVETLAGWRSVRVIGFLVTSNAESSSLTSHT